MKTKDSIVKGETPKGPPARLAHAIPLTKNLSSRAYHAEPSREFSIAWASKVVNLFEHVKSRQTASWVHYMSEDLARQQYAPLVVKGRSRFTVFILVVQ
jgi:hypothetical protein